VTLAKEAGFDVRKEDWLKHHAKQTLELSDEELEGIAGGKWTVRETAENNTYQQCDMSRCGTKNW
jgi:hypothetical protein